MGVQEVDIERMSDERAGFARAQRAAKQDDVRQRRHAHRRDGIWKDFKTEDVFLLSFIIY